MNGPPILNPSVACHDEADCDGPAMQVHAPTFRSASRYSGRRIVVAVYRGDGAGSIRFTRAEAVDICRDMNRVFAERVMQLSATLVR